MKISKLFSSLEKTNQLPSNQFISYMISRSENSRIEYLDKTKANLVNKDAIFNYLDNVSVLAQLSFSMDDKKPRNSRHQQGIASILEKRIPKLTPYADKADDFI